MIELKESFEARNNYDIYIDGVLCEDAHASAMAGSFDYWSFNQKSNEKLLVQDLFDFPNFNQLVFYNLFDFYGFEHNLSISPYLVSKEDQKLFVLFEVFLGPDLEIWKENFSFTEYRNIFRERWKNGQFNFEFKHNDSTEVTFISIKFTEPASNKTIDEYLNPYKQVLESNHKDILNYFLTKFNQSILASFNFPDLVKTSCEQYLLYFAKFLNDIGINATSVLKEESGKVLFSVTPTDDKTALEKIREALAIYLNLPASPIIYDDSFAAMRLQQQIENLQHSQKMAARELQFNEKLLVAQSDIIREKDLLITQKDSTIEQQQKIIEKIASKSIMMDSLENKEEIEEIYEGVKVGESKWLKELTGIGLNPAKAIKTAVKNTFGKDEKKSILGLDED